MVSEAYVYIEDGKYKLEPARGDVKELVKLEHDLVVAIALNELEFMDDGVEAVDNNITLIDDSAVNIGEYFDLKTRVNQQICSTIVKTLWWILSHSNLEV